MADDSEQRLRDRLADFAPLTAVLIGAVAAWLLRPGGERRRYGGDLRRLTRLRRKGAKAEG